VVASTVDTDQEDSLRQGQDVNSSSYLNFHSGQMFADGLSFSGFERNPTWINGGGSFVDMSPLSGADSPNDSRSLLAMDFDDDGDVDLFIHSIQRERHALLRNDVSESPGFLKLRLRGTTGNVEAIGAKVAVRGSFGTTAQVLSRGAGYASCMAPELIFGLGADADAEVEVLWPGGARESFGSLGAGTRAILVEGSGAAVNFAARPRPLPDPLPAGLLVSEGQAVKERFAALDRDGNQTVLDLAELAGGRPILLNFWASYCAPCVAELPYLEKVSKSGEMVVVALSVDIAADREAAVGIVERLGVSFPTYYLTGDETLLGALARKDEAGVDLTGLQDLIDLERLALPTTLILTAEGKVETILRGSIVPDDNEE
jgi:thiol-disulfide isomerase/thioredoxin